MEISRDCLLTLRFGPYNDVDWMIASFFCIAGVPYIKFLLLVYNHDYLIHISNQQFHMSVTQFVKLSDHVKTRWNFWFITCYRFDGTWTLRETVGLESGPQLSINGIQSPWSGHGPRRSESASRHKFNNNIYLCSNVFLYGAFRPFIRQRLFGECADIVC